MWTQRDQLQAYQFLRRRLVSALQTGDANDPVSPSRRLIAGCAAGLACALLISAGFAIAGALRPGAATNWRKPGQVIIERETGATYVLSSDGLLHPMINYTSARLLAGGGGNTSVTVSARSLAGAARGRPLGIPGAPTSLPPVAALVRGPWTVCSQPAADHPATAPPATVLATGITVTDPALDQTDLLMVRDTAGVRYAVTDGRRLRVRDAAALIAIGADGMVPVTVSQAWINALPAGPDLALIRVPASGRAGPRVGPAATRVGEILVASTVGGADRYYVVRTDGLSPVTQTEAALILANPANRAAYAGTPQAVRVASADVTVAPASPAPAGRGYPPLAPRPMAATPDRAVCLVADGSDRVTIHLGGAVPLPATAHPVPVTASGATVPMADEVFLPPGGGAVVRDQPAANVTSGTTYLITDQGIRYPVGGTAARNALGYGGVPPVPLASTMLALYPIGPLLDVAAAGHAAAPTA